MQESRTPNAIVAEGLGKSYGDKFIWSDLSFRVEPGELVAITGPSGSGKTTLLNCVGLLEPVDEGRLTVGGRQLQYSSRSARRRYFRSTVGFLFQNYGLVESWSVDDNLDVALAYSGKGAGAKKTAKREALAAVGLGGMGGHRTFTLSGGEQQRVALARLQLKEPEVVLADEPTAALDDANAEVVLGMIGDFARRGACVLISTHDRRVVERCDRSISLADSA